MNEQVSEPIVRLTPPSLSRRLNDAGFGAQVMAYHEAGKAVRGRVFVGHHGRDKEDLCDWLAERGLVVKEFGAGVLDVSLAPAHRLQNRLQSLDRGRPADDVSAGHPT